MTMRNVACRLGHGRPGCRVAMLRRGVARFGREETGATAIEYALIISLIFLAIIVGVRQAGLEVVEVLDIVSEALRTALDR